MLQKGVADYELAQTFPGRLAGASKSLTKAALESNSKRLYKSYRTQFAGLAAQMYQAKCYEEKGDVGAAMGIYKQLMEHGEPRLRGLQRNVGYFYIVALSKRKEYALAADEAALAHDVQSSRRTAIARGSGRSDRDGEETSTPR